MISGSSSKAGLLNFTAPEKERPQRNKRLPLRYRDSSFGFRTVSRGTEATAILSDLTAHKRPQRLKSLPLRYRDSYSGFHTMSHGMTKRKADNLEAMDAKRTKKEASLKRGIEVADKLKHKQITNFGYPVGQGVCVSGSKHIPNCNGLVATRPFNKGEIITWFHGRIVNPETENYDFRCSYMLSKKQVLIGKNRARNGEGGAAFVNDLEPNNAKLVPKTLTEEDRINFKSANIKIPGKQKSMVRLKATCAIEEGDEITAPYGSGYWRHHQTVYPEIVRIRNRKPF